MTSVEVRPVAGLPRVRAGDDVAQLVLDALPDPDDLRDGDVVVVTSKIVAKAEGRTVAAVDREAAIDAESVRQVARRGTTRVVQTRHGLVLAAAGVDASNTDAGTVVLLPLDPDASARRLRARLHELRGVVVGVVVSDTMGRPWRLGLTDAAVGVAGLAPLTDYRGQHDPYGHPLEQTVVAVADEIAAAGDLVKGKVDDLPVAVVRGLGHLVTAADDDGPGAASVVRPADEDMFRLGHREVVPGAADGARVRAATGDPRPPAGRGGVGRDGAGAAPHHAVALRAGRVGSGAHPAARRDGRAVGRGPARGRVRRGVPSSAACAAVTCCAGRRTSSCRAWSPRARTPTRTSGARPPSARCSWSRWAPAWRTCSSRWPPRGWGRRGCRARCSARTSRQPRSTCRRGGSRWEPSRSAGLPRRRPTRPPRDAGGVRAGAVSQRCRWSRGAYRGPRRGWPTPASSIIRTTR